VASKITSSQKKRTKKISRGERRAVATANRSYLSDLQKVLLGGGMAETFIPVGLEPRTQKGGRG
jgi:hypothetical protein